MGGFYGSVQVRSHEAADVMRAAEVVATKLGIKCLVGPVIGDWVAIYPEGNGQNDAVGANIAEQFPSSDVFHLLVHDDDVFAYWLWRNGQLIDRYWSRPGYFGETDRAIDEQFTGNSEVIAPLLRDAQNLGTLREVLNRDTSFGDSEIERLKRFAELFGISNSVTAYEYLKGGEADGIKHRRKFRDVPGEAIRKDKSQAAARRKKLSDEIQALKVAGILLYDEVRKGLDIPRACATAGDGFVVTWHTPQPAAKLYRSPWEGPQNTPFELEAGQPNSVASNDAGTRIAFSLGNCVRVWDANARKMLLDLPESDWTIEVAITSDGTRIAHLNRSRVSITEVASGDLLVKIPETQNRLLTFHPSGRWVVTAGNTLRVVDLEQNEETRCRQFFVGGQDSAPDLLSELAKISRSSSGSAETEERKGEAIEATLKHAFKQAKIELAGQQLAVARRQIQDQLGQQFAALVSSHRTPVSRAKEQTFSIVFTSDGRYICCGTNAGLRIYAWGAVANSAASSSMPEPIYRFDPPLGEHGRPVAYVYAIIEEPGGKGVIFAGIDGMLRRLDFSSGVVQTLFAHPEPRTVFALSLSADGNFLGVCARADIRQMNSGRRDDRTMWSVYSVPALLQRG